MLTRGEGVKKIQKLMEAHLRVNGRIFNVGNFKKVTPKSAGVKFRASLTWRAEELSAMTLAASLSARDAFCSPSAAITCESEGREANETDRGRRKEGGREERPSIDQDKKPSPTGLQAYLSQELFPPEKLSMDH